MVSGYISAQAFGSHELNMQRLCAGTDPNRPTLVAIKGVVFDVTRNPAYGATGQYRGEYLPKKFQLQGDRPRWRYGWFSLIISI